MVDSAYMSSKPKVHKVEVGIRELRSNLARWLADVKGGTEVIVTERGLPVARIVRAGEPTTMARLVAEGLVTLPTKPKQPWPEPQIEPSGGSVTDLLLQQRDEDPY
jgi:prevent-host-death family protein